MAERGGGAVGRYAGLVRAEAGVGEVGRAWLKAGGAAVDGMAHPVDHYPLDLIVSVGYRVSLLCGVKALDPLSIICRL